MRRRLPVVLAVLLAAASATAPRPGDARRPAATQTIASAQLPADIAGYERWTVLRDRGLPTGGVHPGDKVVYVTPPRTTGPFPPGTIVVKSGTKEGFVHLVALMRKVPGKYPEANGWYFEEYLRETRDAPFRLAFGGPGGQGLCFGCHLQAKDRDFVFSLGDVGR